MVLRPGGEFKISAAPSQELLRKLLYLSGENNGSVLTAGMKSPAAPNAREGRGREDGQSVAALYLARLADPAYQAMSERINARLDLIDEASVRALQEIEEELLALRRERERMLEQAYRDAGGNAIFMAADGSAAYYEDGSRIDDEEFGRIEGRLAGRPTWDAWEDLQRQQDDLHAERDQIHGHDARRHRLRDELAAGRISKEDAEREMHEIECGR